MNDDLEIGIRKLRKKRKIIFYLFFVILPTLMFTAVLGILKSGILKDIVYISMIPVAVTIIILGYSKCPRCHKLFFSVGFRLTVTTIGAAACHLRIGSPVTSLAAFAYTAVQVWYGLRTRA